MISLCTVADCIQSSLGSLNIEAVRTNSTEITFESNEKLFTIACTRCYSWIHDGYSTYGSFYYSDPDFCFTIIKRVRMIIKATPILHYKYSHPYMPSILSE